MFEANKFKLELYADMEPLGGNLKAFQLTLNDGTNGFPAGLFVTSGWLATTESDRLVFIGKDARPEVLLHGLRSNESILFSKHAKHNGLLVTVPRDNLILRFEDKEALAGFETNKGDYTFMANVGSSPFGPAVLSEDTAGNLYYSDFSAGYIGKISPNGDVKKDFATIPPPKGDVIRVFGEKKEMPSQNPEYGDGLLVGEFTGGEYLTGQGTIYKVDFNGKVEPFSTGYDGLELFEFGPGEPYGKELYVATMGNDRPGNGFVYKVMPDGSKIPFIVGISAGDVEFDPEGILGTKDAMYVSDVSPGWKDGKQVPAAGKIWKVTPVQ